MSKEYLAQEKLNDALTQVRLLWQSPCSAAEFNDGVRALVGASQEAVETIKRLRKIAAYVPARVYIEAKEKAGFSEQIVTTASAQETAPAPVQSQMPAEWREKIGPAADTNDLDEDVQAAMDRDRE